MAPESRGGAGAPGRRPLPRRPFRSLGGAVTANLLAAAGALRRHLDGALEPYGVTLSQYLVLRILEEAGPGGIPTLEVASRLSEGSPGISRMMERLERRGWVRRARSPRDRRRVLCALTGPGRALLARLRDPVREAEEEALRRLGGPERGELLRLLETVRGSLG